MKKLFLSMLLSCITIIAAFAQEQSNASMSKQDMQAKALSGSVSNIPECFCCGDAFNLPDKPYIKGPKQVNCGTSATFSTPSCPSATINWTVSPAVAGVTGNTTTNFTIPATATAGTYTVTLTIRCGNKMVTNSFVLVITAPQTCNPAFTFTYTLLPNGTTVNINTVPDPSTQVSGTEHWWGIQYNGTFPNCTIPCAPIPFADFSTSAPAVWGGYINAAGTLTSYMGTGITKGTSGYGINYSGFGVNSCARITHYIKCCGVLYRQTQCVSFAITNNKMVPITSVGQSEMVDVKKGLEN
jgi:hypothetical protein